MRKIATRAALLILATPLLLVLAIGGGFMVLTASAMLFAPETLDALAHAEHYGRGLDHDQTDEFVGMYVNPRTLDYGDDGRRAGREASRRRGRG